jgi:thiamine-monophosphate kinase
MAATPLGVLIALSTPERWRPDLGPLAAGLGDAVAAAGTHIVGGNITRAGELGITVTVLGSSAVPLRRGGARPGDIVYVSGTFGGPLAAIAALQRGALPLAQHQERFARPVARLREAQWLAEAGARSAVDISDGLLADLAHMAAASAVTIAVDLEALPLVPGVSPVDAARSGEEYELAVAAPAPLDRAAFERTFRIPLTPIGSVRAGTPAVEATLAGVRVASDGGWDHFS